jgi:hypothetical protein
MRSCTPNAAATRAFAKPTPNLRRPQRHRGHRDEKTQSMGLCEFPPQLAVASWHKGIPKKHPRTRTRTSSGKRRPLFRGLGTFSARFRGRNAS